MRLFSTINSNIEVGVGGTAKWLFRVEIMEQEKMWWW